MRADQCGGSLPDVDGVVDLHGKVGLWETTVDVDDMFEAAQEVG